MPPNPAPTQSETAGEADSTSIESTEKSKPFRDFVLHIVAIVTTIVLLGRLRPLCYTKGRQRCIIVACARCSVWIGVLCHRGRGAEPLANRRRGSQRVYVQGDDLESDRRRGRRPWEPWASSWPFNFGGKPVYVMPLVFGGAPVVNTLFTTFTSGLWGQVNALVPRRTDLGYRRSGHRAGLRLPAAPRPPRRLNLLRKALLLTSQKPKTQFKLPKFVQPAMTPHEAMHRLDALLSHVWMVRTFIKHSEEVEEDES